MPIDLGNSSNIATGWGPPPQLHAPEIGSLVHAILQNRLARDKMTQESIADTIKNIQGQRQESAYLKAAQDAGLLPPGEQDYNAIQGRELAKQILAKQATDSLIARRAQLEAATGRGRGGGGGSGQPGDATGPEFVYDKDGTKYLVVRTSKSVTYHRVPDQSGGGAPKLSPTEKGWAAPEIPGLSVNINAPDEPATVLQPDVPPMPESPTGGDGTTQPQTGSAGTTDVLKLRQEAQDAIAKGADPEAVKAKFREMTGGVL